MNLGNRPQLYRRSSLQLISPRPYPRSIRRDKVLNSHITLGLGAIHASPALPRDRRGFTHSILAKNKFSRRYGEAWGEAKSCTQNDEPQ